MKTHEMVVDPFKHQTQVRIQPLAREKSTILQEAKKKKQSKHM